jgi:hypothetical protein
MPDEPLGITFRETMTGPFALGETDPHAGEAAANKSGSTLAMHAAVTIEDLDRFVSDPAHTGRLSGHVDFAPLGRRLPASHGVFRLFSPGGQPGLRHMVYELGFAVGEKPYYLAGRKEVRDDARLDLWKDTTTLLTRLYTGGDPNGPVAGAGILQLGVVDLAGLVSTIRVTGARTPADHARALAMFGRFFMGSLWDTYGPKR